MPKRMMVALALAGLPMAAFAKSPCKMSDSGRFAFEGDNAIDGRTGLIWKRCAVGMVFNGKWRCHGEARLRTQQEAQEAALEAGDGWRVPRGDELQSLLRKTCMGPKTDTVAFPDVKANPAGEGIKYWTSTPALPGTFYYFEFAEGVADAEKAGVRLPVRLVRDR